MVYEMQITTMVSMNIKRRYVNDRSISEVENIEYLFVYIQVQE